MREGKNMGIMATLKKPTPESPQPSSRPRMRVPWCCAQGDSRPCSAQQRSHGAAQTARRDAPGSLALL